MVNIELNPLRKNSKRAAYAVVKANKEGTTESVKYYETAREAVYDAMKSKCGDVIYKGYSRTANKLVAFWCEHTSTMRFGFGADDYLKRCMRSDLWWADWDETTLV